MAKQTFQDGSVRLEVDGNAFVLTLNDGPTTSRELKMERGEAHQLRKKWEPHMKNRGSFLIGIYGIMFRSYDVKSTVRVLRKAFGKDKE